MEQHRIIYRIGLAVALLGWLGLMAQPYTRVPLSLNEGLSQSTVFAMAQDSAGFLWFGTQDGLNRYDGYEFEVFKNEPFDATSPADNQVSSLLCDRQNRLWIGFGFSGLDLYQPETRTFRHFTMANTGLTSNLVTCLEASKDGGVWVGTAYGLNHLQWDGTHCTVKRYYIQTTDPKASHYIRTVFEDSHGQVYAGTYKGLTRLNKELDSLVVIPIAPNLEARSSGKFYRGVTAIAEDFLGNLWLGMADGLYLWNRDTDSWARYWGDFQDRYEEFFFSDLQCSPNGDLWASTLSAGVLMLPWVSQESRYHDTWYHFSHRDGVRLHLSSDDVRKVMPDALNPNIVWLGHATSGVEKLIRRSALFSSFDLQQEGLENLGTRFVSDMVTDTLGGLWVGTNRGLVYQGKRKFRLHAPEVLPGGEGYISGLAAGPRGRIWMATPFGMGELVPGPEGNFEIRPCFTNSPPRMIQTLVTDWEGYVYFTVGPRLFVYQPDQDALSGPILLPDTAFNSSSGYMVYSMLRDRKNRLWIGTTRGLIMWPDVVDPMENLASLPARIFHHDPQKRTGLRNEIILSMHEDSEGNIWIGSANGLHQLREVGEEYFFEAYTEKDGLANNFIYGILEDPASGELWLSTNNGLTRFAPRSGSFTNYDAGDGLQSNEFNSHAYFRDGNSGELFFGGINGFTRFFPEGINQDTIPPRVWLTSISLPDGKRRDLLSRTRPETVELGYQNNTFAVHFIGLNYTQPEENRYKYKLEGLNEGWVDCGPTRRVNFSNLPPGEYTFHVIASNSDNVWSPEGDSMNIYIRPPFHRTVWFYLVLALGLGLVLLGAHRLRVREKVRRVLEMERVRKNAAADFHDELGHKLTVIALSGEIAKQKLADRPEVLPQLNKIIANAHSLYYAMKDLLWVLDPTKDSVYDLAILLKDFGDELFDKTGVAFHTEGLRPATMQGRQLAMDQKRHVALMFKEAMNNALKHSGCTEASLSVQLKGDNLRVAFRDNGEGFDTSGLPSAGNGILNMRTRAETIGGRFDVRSGQDGTVVSLELQV